MTINQLTVVGTVLIPPILRETKTGVPVCNFTLRTPRRHNVDYHPSYPNGMDVNAGSGTSTQDYQFFDVTVFGELATNVDTILYEDMLVVLVGEVGVNTWTTPTGETRSKPQLKAREVAVALSDTNVLREFIVD